MNAVNSDKLVPRRAEASSPPPPLLPARPRDTGRLLRADDSDLPPSYEASTLRRPSDAHVRIAVRSSQHASNSASSLPSLIAGRDGRTSINTQGYLLNTPMSCSSNLDRYDHWGQNHPADASGCCCADSEGCCYSSRGGLVCSDRDGCCWGDRGGYCCSDREGCCCSDTNGCCFSSNKGACCSDGRTCCFSRFDSEDPPTGVPTMTVETSNVRYGPR
ncbi:hypothetical protein V8C35DRAFT_169368 [Trichoderma chlorosporum]